MKYIKYLEQSNKCHMKMEESARTIKAIYVKKITFCLDSDPLKIMICKEKMEQNR